MHFKRKQLGCRTKEVKIERKDETKIEDLQEVL